MRVSSALERRIDMWNEKHDVYGWNLNRHSEFYGSNPCKVRIVEKLYLMQKSIHCVQEKIFKIYILIERKEYGGYQRIKRKIYE